MNRARRFFFGLGPAALVLACIGGCGVGPQRHASLVPSGDVPSVLAQTTESAPSSPSVSPSTQSPTSTIFLVKMEANQNRLVRVHRPEDQTSTLLGLIRTLLVGPTDAEVKDGMTSALNTAPELRGVRSGELATIDLGSTFTDIRGQSQVLATAQIVLTAVSFPGVKSVVITIDGAPAAVPLADGTLTSRPLEAADYSCLVVGSSSPCAAGAVSESPSASLTPTPAVSAQPLAGSAPGTASASVSPTP